MVGIVVDKKRKTKRNYKNPNFNFNLLVLTNHYPQNDHATTL